MVLPGRRARGARGRRRASSTCRSRPRVPRPTGSSRCSAASEVPHPTSFVAGLGARDASSVVHRAHRHRARLHALPPRASRAPTRDPLDEKLGPVAPRARPRLLLRRRHLAARRRPAARARRAGSTGSSTQDHRRRGQRRRLARQAARRVGCATLQDGLVRRYALGIAARHRRRCSSTSCSGPGGRRVTTSRSSPRSSSTPIVGALDLPAHARRAGPRSPRRSGYAATAVDVRASRAWLLWDFRRDVRRRSSSSRTDRWIAALGVRYIVGVDGISIFMVAVTALLFPLGLLASEKYIDAPGQGVHRVVPAARGRDHGDLPLPRPHRVLRVLGADARPDVLPHPGMGERAAASTRR